MWLVTLFISAALFLETYFGLKECLLNGERTFWASKMLFGEATITFDFPLYCDQFWRPLFLETVEEMPDRPLVIDLGVLILRLSIKFDLTLRVIPPLTERKPDARSMMLEVSSSLSLSLADHTLCVSIAKVCGWSNDSSPFLNRRRLPRPGNYNFTSFDPFRLVSMRMANKSVKNCFA